MTQKAISNKKAYRDYFFTDKYECGIALQSGEVKSVRAGKVNFKGSFAKADNGQIFIHNLHIDLYKEASYMNNEPDRKRRLLLHKREIRKLENQVILKGLSLVPTKMYFNARGFLKVQIAVGKGKKMYDKRETIKKRTIERSLAQTLRNARK